MPKGTRLGARITHTVFTTGTRYYSAKEVLSAFDTTIKSLHIANPYYSRNELRLAKTYGDFCRNELKELFK